MMKILMISTLLTLSSTLYANIDCQNQFFKYGSGDTANEISTECIESYEVSASDDLKVNTTSGKITAFANAILLKDSANKVIKMIAGEYTTLNNIQSLSYNSNNDELAILEKDTGEIKVFSLKFAGNTAPLRILRRNELIGATSFKLTNEKLCAYDENQKTVYTFSSQANVNRRPAYQNADILSVLENQNELTCL